jgi:cathepsin X
MISKLLTVALVAAVSSAAYQSEYKVLPGHKVKNSYSLPLPHEYVKASDLPTVWDWSNINGTSYVTKSLNQHLPQYCGSCWAHGALSTLADRIKIARGGQGVEINLAIQYILNCGTDVAGSCHGGSQTGVYEFVKSTGYVPYDTCLVYEACSSESTEGDCQSGDYSCKDINICRTCSTFTDNGGKCAGISTFPNASIAEYGELPNSVSAIKAELHTRGPVACGVNAEPILQYHGGVFNNAGESREINHIVSITGWGVDGSGVEYWIVRNSWGEYWGEMGYVRIATGNDILGIESNCAWATPKSWTEFNYPCDEDGGNCVTTKHYSDPALHLASKVSTKAASAALQPQL